MPVILPDNGQAVVLLYDFGPSGATFTNPITITITYDPAKLPAGSSESNLYLAWFDAAGNRWVSLTSSVDSVNKKISAQVTHFTVFALIAPIAQPTPVPMPSASPISPATSPIANPTPAPSLRAASFYISKLDISPNEIAVGESANLNVTVLNNGDLSGSYDVKVTLNERPYTTLTVTVAGHKATTSQIAIKAEAAGIYTVSVEYLKTSFNVVSGQEPIPSGQQAAATSVQSTDYPSRDSTGSRGIPVIWIVVMGFFFCSVVASVMVWTTRRSKENI
jgi:hypothetical protein